MSHQHPLQISLIVKSVFQYVPLDDLSTFRLVCHEWNEIGKMAVIKKRKKIRFTSLKHIQIFVDDMSNVSGIFPFSRFDMDNINFSLIRQRFFQTVHNVTELSLRFSGDNGSDRSIDFETFRETLKLTCNTLEFLEVNCLEASFLRSRRLHPNGEGLIPSELPKLKTLKLFLMCPESPGKLEFLTALFKSAPILTDISCCSFKSAASILKAISFKKNIPLIKNLIILSNEYSDAEYLLILSRSHELRLVTLKLVLGFTIQKRPIDGEVMTEFLTAQKDTLKYLRTSAFTWEGIPFPVMSNLKTLSLTGDVNKNSELFLQELRQITPNLKALEVPVDTCQQVIIAALELWNYLDRAAIESRSTEADPTYPAAASILFGLRARDFTP